MDKYDFANDVYCYHETDTLKNKLNILELDKLEQAERDITTITSQNLHFSPPPYDLSYMQEIHRLLFSELYSWAGEIRSVDISKGGTRFCNCMRIKLEWESRQ